MEEDTEPLPLASTHACTENVCAERHQSHKHTENAAETQVQQERKRWSEYRASQLCNKKLIFLEIGVYLQRVSGRLRMGAQSLLHSWLSGPGA